MCVALIALAAACGPKQTPTPEPRELTLTEKMRMADSMRQAGRMNDALEIIRDAIAERPDEPRLHSLYGQYLFLAGNFPEAESALLAALELDPYFTDARNWLGATYTEQKKWSQAEEQFLRALENRAYPTPEMIYLNLGLLYESQGRQREAIEALRNSVAIDPKFYRAHYQLALALESSGKLDEAAREYEVAEPAYEDVGEFHYRRGFVYFRLGRKDKARESLQRCLAVAPGSPSAAEADELLKVIE
jgi:tetratricopeptide (TPR) repeat protein